MKEIFIAVIIGFWSFVGFYIFLKLASDLPIKNLLKNYRYYILATLCGPISTLILLVTLFCFFHRNFG